MGKASGRWPTWGNLSWRGRFWSALAGIVVGIVLLTTWGLWRWDRWDTWLPFLPLSTVAIVSWVRMRRPGNQRP